VLQRAQQLWVPAVCAVGALLVFARFADYGVTWDEGVQAHYGELTLAYVASGGQDVRFREYGDLRFYGPLVETTLALLYAPWPELRFDIRHLFLGLLALGFVPALAAYARGLGRAAVGPLSVLALLMLPRLLGHATNNSKDVPFALAVSFFMAGLVRLFGQGRRDARSVVGAAVAAGLALAIRPGGLPLLGVFYLAAAALGHAAGSAPLREGRWRGAGLRAAGYWAGALALMVLLWPWAHEAPLLHPYRAILRAAAFDRVVPVLYAGQALTSDTLPRSYLPFFLLVTTPLSTLALAALGLVAETRASLRRGAGTASFTFALTGVWALLPVALAVALRPNLYDGVRHFLFVLPAVAVLAGLGAWHLADRLRRTRLRAYAWAVAVGVLLVPAVAMVRLHPYQSSYFNPLVGWLAGAAGRYETDYWGTSLSEATLWIAERLDARRGAEPHPPTILLGSTSPYPRTAVRYAAGPGIQVVTLGDLAARPDLEVRVDYYLALDRYAMADRFPESPIVHRVERDGATLAVVRDMGRQPVRALPAGGAGAP
jgi:hypothetical protein